MDIHDHEGTIPQRELFRLPIHESCRRCIPDYAAWNGWRSTFLRYDANSYDVPLAKGQEGRRILHQDVSDEPTKNGVNRVLTLSTDLP
jgi:hypothetical protein